jgi:hypothetical protein
VSPASKPVKNKKYLSFSGGAKSYEEASKPTKIKSFSRLLMKDVKVIKLEDSPTLDFSLIARG